MRRLQRGFTVVEMLVAIAVAGLVTILDGGVDGELLGDVLELVGGQPSAHGHQHHAALAGGAEGVQVLDPVVGKEADPVPLGEAAMALPHSGAAAGALVQLAVAVARTGDCEHHAEYVAKVVDDQWLGCAGR